MQKHILQRNPEAEIQVYAIWFNVLARDRRSGWSPDHLDDERVVQYWDTNKMLGTWYRDHLPGHSRTIAWDLYALYGPESRWEKAPSDLVGWGRTIYSEREQLAAAVNGLLKKR